MCTRCRRECMSEDKWGGGLCAGEGACACGVSGPRAGVCACAGVGVRVDVLLSTKGFWRHHV